MARSTEIDSTEVIRNAMIERRNKALSPEHFDAEDAVLFSHVIAALAYCLELEQDPQLKDKMVGPVKEIPLKGD